MPRPNPRRSNGSARTKLRRWLAAQERPCWICKAFGRPAAIDYSLPQGHPMCFEMDELKPVSKWREYGYPSPEAAALDKGNVDATHRRCNQWRGNRSVAEVYALASRRTKGGGLPQPWAM